MHGLDACNKDASTPERLEPEHRLGNSFDAPLVLLDDVVQIFALAHQDIDTGTNLDTLIGRRIGAALVDGDLLGHAVQVDGV